MRINDKVKNMLSVKIKFREHPKDITTKLII